MIDAMAVKVRADKQGRYWLRIDHKGKRKSKLCRSEDHAKALKKEWEALLLLEGGKALQRFHATRKEVTFGDYADDWLKAAENRVARSTYTSYERNIRIHLKPAFGQLPLSAITRPAIKRLILEKTQERIRRGKEGKKRKRKANTIRLIVYPLQSILDEALADGLIASHPGKKLGKFYGQEAVTKDQIHPFTLDELRKVELAASEHYPAWRDLVLTLARTGMRIGEALALQWTDIDLDRCRIHVTKNIPSPFNKIRNHPKTSKGNRWIDINSDELTALLRERRKGWLSERLKKGEKSKKVTNWVFPNEAKVPKPMDYSRVRKVWESIQKKAGVEPRGLHALRHTYASILLSSGENPIYVSEQLGHASPDVTLKIYTRWRPKEARILSANLFDQRGEEKVKSETKTQLDPK